MNVIERIINIVVNNGDANKSLNTTANSLGNVDNNTTKVTQSTKTLTKETHNSTEAIVKNGGAMGLLNELTGGLAMTFKDASEAIELTGVSLKTLKGAILATGVGALIIALGYLFENWEKIKGAIDGTTDALERFKSSSIRVNEERELTNRYNTEAIAIAKNELDIAKANGTSKKEIIRLEGELKKNTKNEIQSKIDLNNIEINGSKESLKNTKNEIIGLNEVISKNDEYKSLISDVTDAEAEVSKQRNNILSAIISGNKIANDIAEVDYEKAKKNLTQAKAALKVYENGNEDIKKRNELDNENLDLGNQLNQVDRDSNLNKANANAEERKAAQLLKDKIKAQKEADARKLNAEEESRLKTIIDINKAIKLQLSLFEKDVNLSVSEKFAKSLNGQYVELTNIYDAQEKLNEQLVKAKELRDIATGTKFEAAQIKEVKNIEEQIDKYKKLGEQKIKNLLISPKGDETLNSRLEIIRLNGEAEIAMIKGFTLDALRIRQDAINLESKLRQKALESEINNNTTASNDNKKRYEDGIIDYNMFTAIKNDIDNKDKLNRDNLAIEKANIIATNQSIELDMYQTYVDKKRQLDDEYYNNLKTVSENLQGFMSQLQNESLIESRDVRNTILVAEKGLAIAQIVFDTIKANKQLKTMATSEYVAGDAAFAQGILTSDPRAFASAGLHYKAAGTATAGIGTNLASAGIGIASIVATTITSWNRPSGDSGGSGGGSGGGGPQAQFNIVESSGNNQLAATIAGKQNQPINTYVVGNDVSTQQALDRNRNQNATFLSLIPFIGLFTMFIL